MEGSRGSSGSSLARSLLRFLTFYTTQMLLFTSQCSSAPQSTTLLTWLTFQLWLRTLFALSLAGTLSRKVSIAPSVASVLVLNYQHATWDLCTCFARLLNMHEQAGPCKLAFQAINTIAFILVVVHASLAKAQCNAPAACIVSS